MDEVVGHSKHPGEGRVKYVVPVELTTPLMRASRACTECRQQKLKCDANVHDYTLPCSRCTKMDLDCVLSNNFKRRKKQTKAQLQDEIDRLRSKVPSQQEIRLSDRRPSMPTEGTLQSYTSPEQATRASVHAHFTLSSASSRAREVPNVTNIEVGCAEDDFAHFVPSRDCFLETKAQTLDGHSIDARRINDCFSIFFRNYAHHLPIVDLGIAPNLHHEESPVLFWTIVVIGSRRYAADPTLLGRLAPSVISLALASLSSRAGPLQLIRALLLLCSWPMPINSMSKDISHVFSGAAMHLAMQIGLHILGVGQEFARTRLKPDDAVVASRAKLWIFCLLVCQRYDCTLVLIVVVPTDKFAA